MKDFKGYKKGVNFGGWLSQCNHTKERYDTFICEQDFKTVADWGCDHIRLPIDNTLIQKPDGSFIEENFSYLQKAIDWAGKYKLNLILDLHKANGFVFDMSPDAKAGLFYDEKYQEQFYVLWEEFAKRYSKYQERVCFELLNEVTSPSYSEPWNKIIHTAISRIRKIAPSITILVGGYWNNSIDAIKDLDKPYDENIVFNFHCYEPFVFTHQGAKWLNGMPHDLNVPYPVSYDEYNKTAINIKYDSFTAKSPDGKPEFNENYFISRFEEGVKICEKYNVALYCGEYGVIENASPESALNWYKDINKAFTHYNLGHASWSYRSMNFGLVDAHIEPVFKEIVKLL